MADSKLARLTYFSSRGRAESIRLLCAAGAIEYEEKSLGVYHPARKTPEFLALRATGTLPFAAVPIWEEPDGLVIAQSDAILRHIARTRGLYGRDAVDAARCDMVLSALEDMRAEVRQAATTEPDKRAALRREVVTVTLPRWLGHFERLLAANGAGRTWVVGDRMTVADVVLYGAFEILHDNSLEAPYASCPGLAAHGERMGQKPGIARYRSSPSRFPAQHLPL